MSVPNQERIIVKKSKTNKDNLYLCANLEALQEAMTIIKNSSALKLWLYLVKNQNGYEFELSQVDCQKWGISRSSYYRAKNELIELGYLVPVREGSNIFSFFDKRQSQVETEFEEEFCDESQVETKESQVETKESQVEQRNIKDNKPILKDNKSKRKSERLEEENDKLEYMTEAEVYLENQRLIRDMKDKMEYRSITEQFKFNGELKEIQKAFSLEEWRSECVYEINVLLEDLKDKYAA